MADKVQSRNPHDIEKKPKAKKKHSAIGIVLRGFAMGIADMIPGISGGTIAFITGIYEELLSAIKSVNIKALKSLFTLKIKDLRTTVHWHFIIALAIGIATAVVSSAQTIHSLLGDPLTRTYLYATFMGLIVASIVFCFRTIGTRSRAVYLAMIIGAIAAYLLTTIPATTTTTAAVYDVQLGEFVIPKSPFVNIWMVVCGALAISAMLLPGISGSYILNILGEYDTVIGAMANFVAHLKGGTINFEALSILVSLGIGVVVGVIVFSRVVSWVFSRWHNIAIATLVGFMAGAMKAVWPFWEVRYLFDTTIIMAKPQMQLVRPILPDITSPHFMIAAALFLAGFVAVFAIEKIAHHKKTQ
ncbi:MAG: DUF368 domain-containing protein [Waddliaceae bacterium]|jgi:putative membrane protein|nr:DUF368 domain-containing protein [Waddliaceae bacterium]MBT3578981.1 DUF368 domain-containing protein [Waddliaceae bacterium]MBT4444669.1 DUF368 domain-containing protein [Waddliaceae bacterium]MBT6929178.1 DUF368 domain-containing protein [Waddliaceae bacterium]MBT7265152.1 DUF368 domain-containing protein [Waddliaceae bacterium]